ncbi:MAG TPA: NYN domain-containing protein [Anaerolineales bacterium]|nr:NYN domain-containing protein [Anaerolineales bacterium]
MKLYTHDRAVLLVDGANFHATMKAHDCEIDWRKLHEYFAQRVQLQMAVYYTRTWNEVDDETKEKDFRPLQPLLDYLAYNSWKVVEKKTTDEKFRSTNLNVEMATDMISFGRGWLDLLIVCSGHGDLLYPTMRSQLHGTKVCIVSSLDPPMCSDALRREAIGFIDAKTLVPHIRREK